MPVTDHLVNLLDTYNELNAAVVDELHEEPSPLEFMRHVALNRPFVIRKGACGWKATREWDADYLASIMGDSAVQVATTPHGNADAVLTTSDGEKLFVEPLEELEPFSEVLRYIISHGRDEVEGPVKYLQTQNDNLREEYAALFNDVPNSIPFARIALQQDPDAVNFWLGSQKSVTALHKDNYQNIYAQIRGKKHFILLPPISAPAVMEKELRLARYESVAEGRQSSEHDLVAVVQTPEELVPVPTWDPLENNLPPNVFGEHVKPVRVTLGEGDMMYLPAMWFHHVMQSAGDEGFSCSVNYW
ncbi:Hypothetical protein D9617_14g075610 [Elsinoe fawcettii]|nr:Hypothetical protein D9617_14g075610 [Elsinoe fawcettii]